MFHPPKDLPPLNPPQLPARNTHVQPALQDPGNLVIRNETAPIETKRAHSLPKIEFPRSQEIIVAPPASRNEIIIEEMPSFDEAIKSIHQDIMKNQFPAPQKEKAAGELRNDKEEYYPPKNLGEGYFSEVRHFIKNRDVREIIDDVLKKDFLTGMKDYHDQRAQGKPFYFHNQDLKEKLERKMEELMSAEENWHELKAQIDENERKRRIIEKDIDAEAQEVKELFKLIKINQVLEKEAKPEEQFNLRNGPKLKSLNDLRKALNYMSEEDFHHHAGNEKNDFASWAEGALGMPEIAQKIRQAKTREDLINTLKNPF